MWGGEVEWARGLDPSTTLIHIDTRRLERAGALHKTGWGTELWQQLQLALPELRAVRLIPAHKTVDSFLGVLSVHGAGKLKLGVCTVYPTTNVVYCLPLMDMMALNEYFPGLKPRKLPPHLPPQGYDGPCWSRGDSAKNGAQIFHLLDPWHFVRGNGGCYISKMVFSCN